MGTVPIGCLFMMRAQRLTVTVLPILRREERSSRQGWCSVTEMWDRHMSIANALRILQRLAIPAVIPCPVRVTQYMESSEVTVLNLQAHNTKEARMNRRNGKTAVWLKCVLLVCCCSLAQYSLALSLDEMKDWYGFTNWAGQTKTNYVRLATNWVPDLAGLSVTNVLSQDIDTNANGTVSSTSMFQPPNDAPYTILVDAYAELSVTNAQRHMLGYFSGCSWHPFVEGTSVGVDIGDRCYLGFHTNDTQAYFVRNNVFVRVDISEGFSTNRYSVVGLARALDEQIRKISVGE